MVLMAELEAGKVEAEVIDYEAVIRGLRVMVEDIKAHCSRCRQLGIHRCGICAMADYKAAIKSLTEGL